MHPDPGGAQSGLIRVPLFPLKTVLFPRGRLALRIFEQRYLTMAKSRLSGETPFGVCLITHGEEVAAPGAAGEAPEIATVGTHATIHTWDMPQLGILHVTVRGGARFVIRSHQVAPDGLVVGEVSPLAAEQPAPLTDVHRPLAELLELLVARIGAQHFPEERAFDDASWVGYRLAELLPLPLSVKQSMLEINDPQIRLAVMQRYVAEHGLLQPPRDGQL
jgi:Lon protease-like protein